MSNAEQIASFLKCADKYAPADQCAPRITPDERRRLVRKGLITMPARRVENRGRPLHLSPEMLDYARTQRKEGASMKQIAVALRVSVSCLQRRLLTRETITP